MASLKLTGLTLLSSSINLVPRKGIEPSNISLGSRPSRFTRIAYLGILLEEAQGFEPWVPCGTSDFKSDAIGLSATLPVNMLLL